MFGYDAQTAHHLRAAGRVSSAYCKNGQEEHEQDDNAYRFRHPVIERIVFGICGHFLNN
jgi:hypothetical protein